MKAFVGASLVAAAGAASSKEVTIPSLPPNYLMMWEHFKEDYGKAYNGVDDEKTRFGIFKANVDLIYDVNSKGLSYQLGVNQFTDLTTEEFAATYTGLKKPTDLWGDLPYLGRHNLSGKALADSVDWSTKGAVTPVKNQAQCGSCWAFSTTGSLEGAWKIATGKLVSLSEQQFVDCDKNGDKGCRGGLMDNAFGYAEKNAVCTEQSYSYKGRGGSCRASSCTAGIPKGGVIGFKDVAKDDEQALMEAVQQQPVSIAIQANMPTFQSYKRGILSGICGAQLDHGVLAVGYGTDNGQDYWKVKNSWGTRFGEEGYVRLLRGKRGAGECGLLSGPPSYPAVSGVVSGITLPEKTIADDRYDGPYALVPNEACPTKRWFGNPVPCFEMESEVQLEWAHRVDPYQPCPRKEADVRQGTCASFGWTTRWRADPVIRSMTWWTNPNRSAEVEALSPMIV